jgi:transcriptional regulator with XRE-family HTH domain
MQALLLSRQGNKFGYIVPDMKPGDIVKETREARGLSQRDLGKAVGISQVAIKKIESGDTVKSKHLAKVAEVLELELSSLDPSLRAKPAAVKHLSTKSVSAKDEPHAHFRNPHDMFLWNQGDGYRIDEPELTTDEEIRKFLAPYISGVAENKYEIWFINSDVMEKGPCKAGSYLVVEMGAEPNPRDVVLAVTNKKVPIFRNWVGRILVPAPKIPSTLPALFEGRDATVLGVVRACYPPPGAT